MSGKSLAGEMAKKFCPYYHSFRSKNKKFGKGEISAKPPCPTGPIKYPQALKEMNPPGTCISTDGNHMGNSRIGKK
jgi:hypothetical protein